MAILNPSPVLALPAAMWLAYRYIQSKGPLDRESWQSALCPPAFEKSTPQDGAHSKKAISTLIELELVLAHGADQLAASRPINLYAEFIDDLRNRVYAANGATTSAPGVSSDLVAGCAWLLSRSPAQSLTWRDAQAARDLPSELVNDTRWNALATWSEALGFARNPLGLGVIPDPTEAILDAIRTEWPAKDEVSIGTLLQRLVEQVPVLPGGSLSGFNGGEDDEFQVSFSVSWALLCAQQAGIITMNLEADAADRRILAIPDYQWTHQVSSVTIKGKSRA